MKTKQFHVILLISIILIFCSFSRNKTYTYAATDTTAPIIDYSTYIVDEDGIDCYVHAYDPGSDSSGLKDLNIIVWNGNIGNYSTGYSTTVKEGSYTINNKSYNYHFRVNKSDFQNYTTKYYCDARIYDNANNHSAVWNGQGSCRSALVNVCLDVTGPKIEYSTYLPKPDKIECYMYVSDPEPASGVRNVSVVSWNKNIGNYTTGITINATPGIYEVNGKTYNYYYLVEKKNFQNYDTGYYSDARAYDNNGNHTTKWDGTGSCKSVLYDAGVDNTLPIIDYYTHVIDENGIDVYIHAYDPGTDASGMNEIMICNWNVNYQESFNDGIIEHLTKGSYSYDGKDYNYYYRMNKSDFNNEITGYVIHAYAIDNAGNKASDWNNDAVKRIVSHGSLDVTLPVIDRYKYVADETGFHIYANAYDPEPNASGMNRMNVIAWNTNIGNFTTGIQTRIYAGDYTYDGVSYNYYYYIKKSDFQNWTTGYYCDIYAVDNSENKATDRNNDAVKGILRNANAKEVIKFDGNKPSSSKTTPVLSSTKSILTPNTTYGTLPTAAMTDWSFDGWYTEKTGGTKIENNAANTVKKDQILYAHWSANPPTIMEKPSNQEIIASNGLSEAEYVNKHTENGLKHNYSSSSIQVKIKPEANHDYSKTKWTWKISKNDGVSWNDLVSSSAKTSTTAEATYETVLEETDDGVYIRLNISNIKKNNSSDGKTSSIDGYKYKVFIENSVGTLEVKSVETTVYWLPKIGK